MARPFKPGLDYFSVYIDFFSDMKIKRLIRAVGGESIAVLLNLYAKIYENGYYINFDEDLLFFISEELKFNEEYVTQVIKEMLELNILESELFMKFGVLTSESIQDMFNKAMERRKIVVLINEIWLIDESVIHHENKKIKPIFEKISILEAEAEKMINVNMMYTQTKENEVNVDNNHSDSVANNQVNANINSINDNNGTQTKTKNKTNTENETYTHIYNQSIDRPSGLSSTSDDELISKDDKYPKGQQILYQGRLSQKEHLTLNERDFIKIANFYPNQEDIDEAIPIFEEMANKDGFNLKVIIGAITVRSGKSNEMTLKEFLGQYFK